MLVSFSIVIKIFLTILLSLILTPIFKIISVQTGMVDKPNERRINKVPMPSAGGLPIFVSFVISSLFLFKDIIPKFYILPILLAASVIVLTGLLDDKYELSPKQKSIGILLAALIIYFVADIRIDSFTLPFLGYIQLGWLSFPVTIFWIFGITNAVNLIDGLDGLAAGISLIGLITIGIIGYFFLHASTVYIPIVIFCLVASIIGFFPYNFYPAKIYLGDTGALFLGFMMAVLSLQGLKNVTFVSSISLLIIMGVPVTDTFFAIIRRKANRVSFSTADKKHLHHRLLALGFTHKGAVLTIYSIALMFSFTAMIMNYTGSLGTIALFLVMLFAAILLFELIGLINEKYQFILKTLRFLGNKEYRTQVMQKYFKKWKRP
ncbi:MULTISPECIES: MraY family glycosyltransferase [Enterococcus]|uniref:Undecaprenyl/decaprenyl-phosphate alpha-N-acetylglucosaminyl 1-phosphate transferase n=1 Tax=Enterococcus mundtii TaxID=53346 RepID=A0A2T5DCV5_ENTMU|nr:MraY family glycosyltransferase [Enterococcus mundtii]MBE6171307.1 undecaprenyl/decaprenyl-phosphate alpha-N-acetylglucosaminyl 1-phosphate transferase [Enterococcus faecium]MBO1086451.1 undecaprenyl/decaprenyl-phosphate alpha-N-acetylglucosaminyl 1-phosphate transferase [Enterococcus mundtii]OBS61856.1 UDP-N-acetylglucosamine--UDP-P N-acetylglucosaminyl-1-P transferase [Enterococcus mundtii]PTO35429.1 undecaprenyl/decaprenyl-phosphate alpha-N-acetylglucosaminyl 1-phosphate transferase [Ente